VVVVFAVLAALSNGVSVTAQHIASTAGTLRSAGWRLIFSLVRSPLWLFGAAAQAAAFVFQALALHNGPVSIVQPLLVTELVLVLALRRIWLHQSIVLAAWNGAVLTSVGLAVFIVAGEPRGGRPVPTSHHWIAAIAGTVAVTAALMFAARRGSPSRRAALYAGADGIVWALEAAFIKATTDTITQFGAAGMFLRWPVYATMVGGAAGVLLQQQALHVGPLRISQPVTVIVDPIASIALSVWLFDEYFTSNIVVLAVAAAGFAVMCVGVVYLTQNVPATMEADSG
jgi:drug/metabolite transporter (DMT)-like permease